MNLNRIRTIIDKEWEEVFKNRMVLFTIGFLPIIFTLLPLVIMYVMGTSGGGMNNGDLADVPPQFLNTCGNLPAKDCLQVYIMQEFMLMFMMMPLIIPTAIAAYSIVGEKTTRSLEPLLATPITTAELLTGKALAAALPAVFLTWLSFGIFVLLLPLVGATPGLLQNVISATWLMAVLIIGPLMAIAAVNVAVIVSSRVNDPRVAEQVSGVMIVPVLGLLFAQLAGIIILSPTVMGLSIIFMLVVDAALIYFGVNLFQREAILTRWK